mgnify:CR=1 FL=1
MSEAYEHDLDGLKEVQGEATILKTTMDPRKENWEAIEDAVFMDWKKANRPSGVGAKVTISPSMRNKVLGVSNMLTAAEPSWNIPKDKNSPDAEAISSKLEKASNTMWKRSNSVQGKRIERQCLISGAMYDEIHVRVVSTKDILDATKGKMAMITEGKDYDQAMAEAEVEQAKLINERTPYLFKALPPVVCTPLWSSAGPLSVHYTETAMLVADVKNEYGDRAAKAIGAKKDYTIVNVCEWWDKVYRFTWLLENKTEPIYAEAHGLKFLPVAARRVVGSDLFLDAKRQNEPFLYGALKSGIWYAQNSMLTALATNLLGLINAGWYYQKASEDDVLSPIDFSAIGGVISGRGSMQPLSKNIVDQNSTQLWAILDGLFEDSTIYGTALGEKLSSNMTFSETALLAQQGRLPIVPQQSALQEILADAMNIAIRWMKQEGGYHVMFDGLRSEDIPNIVEYKVVVEPNLPQDKLQQAQVSSQVSGGQDPLVPKRWARENVLNEGQSDDLQREIWNEQMSQAAFGAGIQETLMIGQKAAEALMAMINPQQQDPNAQPQGQPTPEQMAQMQQQGPPQQPQQQQPSPEQIQQMMMEQGQGMPPEMGGNGQMPPTQVMPPTPGGLL